MNRKVSELLGWVVAAGAAIAIALYGYTSAQYRHAHAISDNGCLAYLRPPAILAVASDVTDPLEGDQPGRWRATVEARVGSMPPGTKTLFTTIGASAPAEVKFQIGPCTPPLGGGPRLTKLHAALEQTVGKAQAQVQAARAMNRSAIRATILTIAADPAFGNGAKQRVLLVESDMLEADGVTSAYRPKSFAFPPPVGMPLKGVTLYLVVLKNMRDARYQTPAIINAWISWGHAAGANVIVDCPTLGFLPPTEQSDGGHV